MWIIVKQSYRALIFNLLRTVRFNGKNFAISLLDKSGVRFLLELFICQCIPTYKILVSIQISVLHANKRRGVIY